jgi:hypothetical protein
MGNRSLFPDAVEVHGRHLRNESRFRDDADKRNLLALGMSGVLSGFEITINAGNNTRIDISAGSGYTPNGEYVEAGPFTNVALADSSSGAVNYILIVYDELQSEPEAHETDGTTRFTKATASPRLAVLTALDYNALPQSEPTLILNSKDRALIIGIVVGTGGALTPNSITMPRKYSRVLEASQPVNITGVKISSISPGTQIGTGTLTWNAAPGNTLTWQAPGDGAPGAPTSISSSGEYTVTSSGGTSIKVVVTFSLLPSTNKSDSIVISDIYTDPVARFTAEDWQHRTMLGSGNPTVHNPHGMTFDDLSPGVSGSLEEHQDLAHSNGIAAGSSPSLLTATVNTVDAPDKLSVTGFSPGDVVYINGKKVTAPTGTVEVTFTDGSINPALYGIYLSQNGTIFKHKLVEYSSTSGIINNVQIVDVENVPPGTYTIKLVGTSGIGGTPGALYVDKSPPVVGDRYGVSDYRLRLILETDAIHKLPHQSNSGRFIVYVKQSIPSFTISENITVFAPPDPEENFHICNVPWSGISTGFLGYGFGAANSPNGVWDKRVHGTLGIEQARRDNFTDVVRVLDELVQDGFVIDYPSGFGDIVGADITNDINYQNIQHALDVSNPSTVIYTGGIVYMRGKRYIVPRSTFNISGSDGTYYLCVIANDDTSAYAVPVHEPIMYSFVQHGKPLLIHSTIDVSGGGTAATATRNDSAFCSLKKNVPYGVVGLDGNKKVALSGVTSSTSEATLTVNVSGNGKAIQAFSSNNAASSAITARSSAGVNYTAPVVDIYQQGTGGAGLRVTNASNSNISPLVDIQNNSLTGNGLRVHTASANVVASGPLVEIHTKSNHVWGHGLFIRNETYSTSALVKADVYGNTHGVYVETRNNDTNKGGVHAYAINAGPAIYAQSASASSIPIKAIAADGSVNAIETSGNIATEDDFVYTNNRTGQMIIPACDFVCSDPNLSPTFVGTDMFMTVASVASGAKVWQTKIHGLPLGSKITSIEFTRVNSDTGNNRTITVRLLRQTPSATHFTITIIVNTDIIVSGTSIWAWQSAASSLSETVGTNSAYIIELIVNSTSSSGQLRVGGIRVTYTYDTLVPGTN